jgi:hypothetical protein
MGTTDPPIRKPGKTIFSERFLSTSFTSAEIQETKHSTIILIIIIIIILLGRRKTAKGLDHPKEKKGEKYFFKVKAPHVKERLF